MTNINNTNEWKVTLQLCTYQVLANEYIVYPVVHTDEIKHGHLEMKICLIWNSTFNVSRLIPTHFCSFSCIHTFEYCVGPQSESYLAHSMFRCLTLLSFSGDWMSFYWRICFPSLIFYKKNSNKFSRLFLTKLNYYSENRLPTWKPEQTKIHPEMAFPYKPRVTWRPF